MAEDHVSWTLCEYCQNELNGACYARRTVYQQIEQKGGHVIDAAKRESCPRYRHAEPEEKEAMRREAAWYIESEKWMHKSKKKS